jgi:hypothetical protein
MPAVILLHCCSTYCSTVIPWQPSRGVGSAGAGAAKGCTAGRGWLGSASAPGAGGGAPAAAGAGAGAAGAAGAACAGVCADASVGPAGPSAAIASSCCWCWCWCWSAAVEDSDPPGRSCTCRQRWGRCQTRRPPPTAKQAQASPITPGPWHTLALTCTVTRESLPNLITSPVLSATPAARDAGPTRCPALATAPSHSSAPPLPPWHSPWPSSTGLPFRVLPLLLPTSTTYQASPSRYSSACFSEMDPSLIWNLLVRVLPTVILASLAACTRPARGPAVTVKVAPRRSGCGAAGTLTLGLAAERKEAAAAQRRSLAYGPLPWPSLCAEQPADGSTEAAEDCIRARDAC